MAGMRACTRAVLQPDIHVRWQPTDYRPALSRQHCLCVPGLVRMAFEGANWANFPVLFKKVLSRAVDKLVRNMNPAFPTHLLLP